MHSLAAKPPRQVGRGIFQLGAAPSRRAQDAGDKALAVAQVGGTDPPSSMMSIPSPGFARGVLCPLARRLVVPCQGIVWPRVKASCGPAARPSCSPLGRRLVAPQKSGHHGWWESVGGSGRSEPGPEPKERA